MKFILKILIFYLATINASFAYLDPGSGSVILQAIIGFIAAIFATLSFYWGKFKLFILKLFKKEKKSEKE
tara:strand:- start:127 stop:336 length:210 start_codon:yes stop_codon:yes gene_type:complete